jgi:hypothetical protein
MIDEKIIDGIIDRLNDGDDDYDIEKYLERKEINSNEFEKLIETAKNKILVHKLETYPKQNKFKFIFWTSLFVIFFILFFFILPKSNINVGIIALSITGAICTSLSGFFSWIYYKSWSKDFIEKVGKPKVDLQIYFMLSAIPNVILYFIISWCFSSGNDSILKETQENAIATVLYGSAREGRRYSYANVTVEFETKEGKKIIAVEDVSTYQFKQFYEGQVLNIVYSKDNPKNIDLLIDEDNVKELKSTQEREIEPEDLIKLTSINFENIDSELKTISYGWHYDETNKAWINERKKIAISKNNDANQLVLIASSNTYNYTFPKKFAKLGFVKTSKKDAGDIFEVGEKIFENEKYIVSIQSEVSKENSVIIINRK